MDKVGLLIANAKIGYALWHEFVHFLIFQSNMILKCPLLMISVNHMLVPQSLRIFVEQVTPQGSGEMCFSTCSNVEHLLVSWEQVN